MSKVVLLGDTHFHYSKANPIFHRYFEKFYKFMFSYMNRENIKSLIQLGDLFDNRREIHYSSIKEINEYFFTPIKDANIDAYVISGNHDVLFKNSSEINSISLLCPSYINIIDKEPNTCIIGSASFDLFPWINESNFIKSLDKAKNTKSDFAVGHFEFVGFPMYPGSLSESGTSHTEFSSYKKVFSGHFHTISMKDNILYTGTPYELNWTDCNDPKGFWVLDTDTGKMEYVKNPYKLYERITYVEDMDYEFSNVRDKFVKVTVAHKESQKKFDKFVDNINHNNPISVNVSDLNIQKSVEKALDVSDVITTKSMIESVIDNIDTQLDKTLLKRYIIETYTDALNLSKE